MAGTLPVRFSSYAEFNCIGYSFTVANHQKYLVYISIFPLSIDEVAMDWSMPTLAQEFGFLPFATIVIIAGACATYWLFIKSPWAAWLSKEDPVAPFFTAITVLFALFAAMLASDIWGRHKDANTAQVAEASAIRSITETAGLMPKDDGQQLLRLIDRYVDAVTQREWPAMATNNANQREAALPEMKQLESTTLRFLVTTNQPKAIETRLINAIDALRTARLQRLTLAFDGISYAKWRALLAFGLLSLLAVGSVHMRKPRAMGIALTIAVAGVLMTLAVLTNNQSPYSGTNPVKPHMLQDAVRLPLTLE